LYATYSEARPLVEMVPGRLLPGLEEYLFNKVKAVPEGGRIMEIGPDHGRSTCAMALACSGSDKRIISIDAFRDREETPPAWSGRPMLDLVFIDGSREFSEQLKVFRQIYPYVKAGGWIAFQDAEPLNPGTWRVWLEHAAPLMIDHETTASIACGRKAEGRSLDWAPKHSGFSFAGHWADYLARASGEDGPWVAAMRASLSFASVSESQRQAIIQSEQALARLPGPLAATLSGLLAKEAHVDGHLHLWNGLILMAQGKMDEARGEVQESRLVSYPVHPAHASHYLSRLGGAEARPSFSKPVDAGASAGQTPGGGYYGKDYFDWQKRIGAFGGVANLFKFRDHVKDTDVVVDFGSGGGFLLRNLPGRMKIGIEINGTARREACLRAGIDAFASAAELPDAFADVIVSNHALEHVESPLEALRALRMKLKPGGRMVCVVPHEGPQIAFDPADVNKHLYTWNPMTLGNLFTAAGFEVVACENLQHQWPPNFVDLFEKAGEAAFHQACREHAMRNGTFQVRIIATAQA